jgi:hypothetical protein
MPDFNEVSSFCGNVMEILCKLTSFNHVHQGFHSKNYTTLTSDYIEKLLFDNNFSMIIMEKKISVYDSSYFLPLFASLLSYGNLLDCRKFIEINALGFVVVATSSLVINVRRIAYYLLDEFYVLLEVCKYIYIYIFFLYNIIYN